MTDIDYSDYLDNENNPEMAGFLLRLFASIIDTIILMLLFILVISLFVTVTRGIGSLTQSANSA